MKQILFFVFAFLLVSCQPPISKEQYADFNAAKKMLIENKSAYIRMSLKEIKNDSAQMFLDDVEKNNLDELVEKYKLKEKNEIDSFILAVSITANLAKADSAMSEIENIQSGLDSIFDKASKLDTSDLMFDKIKSKQVDTSLKKGYILKGNKYENQY